MPVGMNQARFPLARSSGEVFRALLTSRRGCGAQPRHPPGSAVSHGISLGGEIGSVLSVSTTPAPRRHDTSTKFGRVSRQALSVAE